MLPAKHLLLEITVVTIRCKIKDEGGRRKVAEGGQPKPTPVANTKELPMIKAIAQLLGTGSAKRVDALSRQVAESSLESVCKLVLGHVESMSFSEARGYTRARASGIVRKQARVVISRGADAEQAWEDDIVRAATEQLVPLVLRQTGVGVLESATKLRLAA